MLRSDISLGLKTWLILHGLSKICLTACLICFFVLLVAYLLQLLTGYGK